MKYQHADDPTFCPTCGYWCESAELIPRDLVAGVVQPARCLACRSKDAKHGFNYEVYEGDWLLFEGNRKMCKHFTSSLLGASNRKDWINRLRELDYIVKKIPIKEVSEIFI